MLDYNVCRNLNKIYFSDLLFVSIPDFFSEGENLQSIQEIKTLLEQNNIVEALTISDQKLKDADKSTGFPFKLWHAFLLWRAGQLSHEQLRKLFESILAALPHDAWPDFNIAVLHIAEENFNESMEFLDSTLLKDPLHPYALELKLRICYLSADQQWHALYDQIDNQNINNEVANSRAVKNFSSQFNWLESIDFVENIKARPSCDFNNSDTQALVDQNEVLLKSFPEIQCSKAPTSDKVIFVSADSSYFNEYVTTLLFSALELQQKSFGIHVHLYGPMASDIELLEHYDATYPELKLSYSWEKTSPDISTKTYYASMRFPRAYQVFDQFEVIQEIAIIDADMLIRKNPFENKIVEKAQVVVTYLDDPQPKWDAVLGGFNLFKKHNQAIQSIAYLSKILLEYFVQKKARWLIDQIALFEMFQRYATQSWFASLSAADVVGGVQMIQDDRSIFWTYTLGKKLEDNPMNSERNRLRQKYKITRQFNDVVQGKYGQICINKNDEYIGKSISILGSWCDHEIQIMKSLLDFGDNVIEVGANIGSHTVPLAQYVGESGKVIAIEPQRLIFQSLCANVAINSLSNVFTMNIGLGKQEERIYIEETSPREFNNFGAFKLNCSPGEFPVDVKTLDSLDVKNCKFIKIDAEGMEIDIFKGAVETLKNDEPLLFFESHGDAIVPIQNFLKDFGYVIYKIDVQSDPMFLACTNRYQKLVQLL